MLFNFDDVHSSTIDSRRCAAAHRDMPGMARSHPDARPADRSDRTGALLRVALGVAGPVALALVLPSPSQILSAPSGVAGPVAVLDSAILSAVTVVNWCLLGWTILVVLVAALTRLPGATGRAARTVLRSVVPAGARRILIVAAGVSLAAGLSACGGQVTGPVASAPGIPAVSTTQPSAGPTAAPSDAPVEMLTSPSGTASPAAAESTRSASRPAAGPASRIGGYTGSAAGNGPRASGTASAGAVAGRSIPSSVTDPLVDLDWPAQTRPDPTAGTGPTTDAVHQEPDPGPPVGEVSTPPLGAHPTGGPEVPSPIGRPGRADRAPAPQHNEALAAATPHMTATAPTVVVTVRAGDSLWAIAARQLPASATDAQIDAQWRSWYRLNHDVVGDDPDLILPGQQLIAPPMGGTS